MPRGVYARKPKRKAKKAAHANPAMETVASKRVAAAIAMPRRTVARRASNIIAGWEDGGPERMTRESVRNAHAIAMQRVNPVRTLNFAVKLDTLVSLDVGPGEMMTEAQIRERIMRTIMAREELPELRYVLVDIR